MIELAVLAIIGFTLVALFAAAAVVLALVKAVLWLVLLPFRILFGLLFLPLLLLKLVLGGVLLFLLTPVLVVAGVVAVVAGAAAVVVPLLPLILLGLILYAIVRAASRKHDERMTTVATR